MSAACELKVNGKQRWWLCRESGRVPAVCVGGAECGCNKTAYLPRELRRSYLVFLVREKWPVVRRFIVEWSALGLAWVAGQSREGLTIERVDWKSADSAVAFVEVERFRGVDAEGLPPWFRGVTDAVDADKQVGPWRPGWLRCVSWKQEAQED